MICVSMGCHAELWFSSQAETEAAMVAASWRWWRDGKQPPMNSGSALCAEHVGEASKYPPKKKGAR